MIAAKPSGCKFTLYTHIHMQRVLLILSLMMAASGIVCARESASVAVPCSDCACPARNSRIGMSRNVFAELFGPSFGFGVGFDSRFRQRSVFGYRVGISWTDGDYGDDQTDRDLHFRGVCLPLELNAILGRGKSKFEIGIGATPSVLRRVYSEMVSGWIYDDDWNPVSPPVYRTTRGTKLNILGTLNLGYRYQRESGFFMRLGLTFCFGDLDVSPIDGLWPLPNLSLGYTFRH